MFLSIVRWENMQGQPPMNLSLWKSQREWLVLFPLFLLIYVGQLPLHLGRMAVSKRH
jgi:hypothetical protein